MKKGFILLFLFFISGIILFAQSDDLKAEIEKINSVMEEAVMNNNTEVTLEYYTEDAISMPSYQPMMKGMDALKEAAEMHNQQAMEWNDFKLESLEIFESGDFVIDVGTYKYSMNMPGMEEPYTDHGKYVTVYEKQDDGSLKIKIETWNSDVNPWAMMSGEAEPHEEKMMEKETIDNEEN